jgi:hypothetical protein
VHGCLPVRTVPDALQVGGRRFDPVTAHYGKRLETSHAAFLVQATRSARPRSFSRSGRVRPYMPGFQAIEKAAKAATRRDAKKVAAVAN